MYESPLAAPAAAQTDLIYYPFVAGTGTTVTNFAAGGPKTGTVNFDLRDGI